MTEVNNVASTVLTTLDVGSGIDIVKLSEDLTNAEKEPKQEKIQGDIDATEASISAYALVKFQVNALKSAFENLNDANEIATRVQVRPPMQQKLLYPMFRAVQLLELMTSR